METYIFLKEFNIFYYLKKLLSKTFSNIKYKTTPPEEIIKQVLCRPFLVKHPL